MPAASDNRLFTTASGNYVCEGEKAADAAATIGLLATTSPHGCESAGKADWRPLAGREVVILPDNDDAGQGYAKDMASILIELQPAAKVKIVALPGLPPKGDIYDWLEDHDGSEPDSLRAAIESLVDAAPPVDAHHADVRRVCASAVDGAPGRA